MQNGTETKKCQTIRGFVEAARKRGETDSQIVESLRMMACGHHCDKGSSPSGWVDIPLTHLTEDDLRALFNGSSKEGVVIGRRFFKRFGGQRIFPEDGIYPRLQQTRGGIVGHQRRHHKRSGFLRRWWKKAGRL